MKPLCASALLLAGAALVLFRGACLAAETGWSQRQFLITFWRPPPATDQNLTRVAAEGFNLTWTTEAGLDVAARHGLRAMLTSDLLDPATLDDDAKRVRLDALIARVRRHPALEAYFLTDEPGAGAFAGLGRLVAYLRERDPAHLAYINLFPTYADERQLGVSADAAARARVGYPTNFAGVGADDKTVLRYREHLRRYVETVRPDLISYDHYHFLKSGDGTQYFLNLALIRQAAREAGKPFLNIIQADTTEKSWRLPTGDEVRWLVFTTLAYGARGISYFIYWGPKDEGGLYQDGRPAPLLKPVTVLNRELAKLGPALMELDSLAVYQSEPLPRGAEAAPSGCPVRVTGTGGFVLGLFGRSPQPSAFMLVNRNYTKPGRAMVKVLIPGRILEELDRRTGKWEESSVLQGDRTVEISLAPGDGRLFRVPR
jgi:hypothetical protein